MSLVTLRWTCSLMDICIPNFHHQLMKRCMSHLSMESSETAVPFPLLGPPEIYLSAPSLKCDVLTAKEGKGNNSACYKSESSNTVDQKPASISDPFMDMMVNKYNDTVNYSIPAPRPFMGFTENHSPTFLSSGNPCLDFFFHVVPNTPPKEVTRRLQLAWDQNPLTALKLVCNLRGVRGKGKADREGFYAAALWLHEKHPKTLACNAPSFATFGYFKDLLEILYRLLEGPDARANQKKEISERYVRGGRKWHFEKPLDRISLGKIVVERCKWYFERQQDRISVGKKVVEKYNSDPVYRFLHNQISQVFAEALKADLENMNAGKKNISFAAKWCPSLYKSYDRSTLVCESIARILFPRNLPEYDGLEDAHYAFKVRARLRKEVLVPLRQVLKVPEVYMCAKQWSELPYNRVPSIAMKNYMKLFFKHDEARFREYLDSVKSGKATIAAGALLPHEIIESLCGEENTVAELQWQRIVDDLSAIGKLKNCLAICDVSGSMYGTPLDVSIALGLLVSDLSEEPWKGKLITFSNNPQLQMIEGESLQAKVSSVAKMHWDMNTNFQKVFDKILEVAKMGNLREDKMVKRLFVFSDMEFDTASANPWETDYEAICRKFHANGYTSVPEIVFWNLRNSEATPVPSHQKGVALVSGFSKNLLTLFLEEGEVVTPEHTMELAISGEEYSKLIVVD